MGDIDDDEYLIKNDYNMNNIMIIANIYSHQVDCMYASVMKYCASVKMGLETSNQLRVA